MVPVSCFGKEGPSNWHELLCCLPGAAAAEPLPFLQASQVTSSKETSTEQARRVGNTGAGKQYLLQYKQLPKNKEGCLQIRSEDFGSGDS